MIKKRCQLANIHKIYKQICIQSLTLRTTARIRCKYKISIKTYKHIWINTLTKKNTSMVYKMKNLNFKKVNKMDIAWTHIWTLGVPDKAPDVISCLCALDNSWRVASFILELSRLKKSGDNLTCSRVYVVCLNVIYSCFHCDYCPPCVSAEKSDVTQRLNTIK